MNFLTSNRYFITGTDTEIGKTLAACALIHALIKQGKRVIGMKPVAAGRGRNGQNDDVRQLQAAANVSATEPLVCPYLFDQPVAPHLAAQRQGVSIDSSIILSAYQRLAKLSDCVVIEGAGGLLVPLGNTGKGPWDTAELIQLLDCPVVLVVGLKLGCINHALLTQEALQNRKIPVAGWIANQIDSTMALPKENLHTLIESMNAPLLGKIPFLANGEDALSASHYLNL